MWPLVNTVRQSQSPPDVRESAMRMVPPFISTTLDASEPTSGSVTATS